jgi:tetratricopeptide (TPR) repeat protein
MHRRVAFWTAVLLWVSILGSCITAGSRFPESWWPFLASLATAAAPFAFQIWAIRPEVKREQRRHQSSSAKTNWAAWLIFLAALALSFVYIQYEWQVQEFIGSTLPHGQELFDTFLLLAILLGVAFVLLWILPRARKHLELEIATLLQQHQWQRAVDFGERNRKRVSRSPAARHNIAFAKLKLGRWDEAVTDLEQLRLSAPALKQTWITLAMIAFEQDLPEKALEFARELQQADRRDPAAPYLASRALRELGRLDEAAHELAVGRSGVPDDPTGLAGEAMLRLARGDVAGARELIPELERLAPGDTTIPFIEAEIAFAENDLPAVRQHLERAAQLVSANPFTLCERRLARLQRRLTGIVGDEDPRQRNTIGNEIETARSVP